MIRLAQKLIMINELPRQTNTVSSSILGTTNLPISIGARPDYRIGMWPCVNETMPEVSMGLWTALGYLLEVNRQIQVYRIFTQLDEDATPDDYQWQTSDSQFDVDDWGLDGLDENIALWGNLQVQADKWQLNIYLENDLLEDEQDEPQTLSLDAPDLPALITQLPDFATQILHLIQPEMTVYHASLYTHVPEDVDHLKSLLGALFTWENRLYLTLWGQEWNDDDILQDHATLRQAAQTAGSDFGAWAITQATARAMLPGLSLIGELLVDEVGGVVGDFKESSLVAPLLARRMYGLGYVERAFQLLTDEIVIHRNHVDTWLTQADLYARSNRLSEAIDALQSAIEEDTVNIQLYRMYAVLLGYAHQYDDMPVTEYILVDPQIHPKETIVWELIAAHDEVLALEPEHGASLHDQAIALMERDDSRFWATFERLVKADAKGDLVRDVLDLMYTMADVTPAFAILNATIQVYPDRPDLYANLAVAYMLDEQDEQADDMLQKAQSLTDDPLVLADIEQLRLIAEDPEFEMEFGEIQAVIDAGNRPQSDGMDFLEGVVEKAPNFADGYLLLSRAYELWDDFDAALETLLDAQKRFPDDVAVLEQLAHILWESGEEKLAFDYLSQGLQNAPDNVPLLVRTGRYLFDDGQLAEARAYLARAEAINARDPFLKQTQAYIAAKVAEQDLFNDAK